MLKKPKKSRREGVLDHTACEPGNQGERRAVPKKKYCKNIRKRFCVQEAQSRKESGHKHQKAELVDPFNERTVAANGRIRGTGAAKKKNDGSVAHHVQRPHPKTGGKTPIEVPLDRKPKKKRSTNNVTERKTGG